MSTTAQDVVDAALLLLNATDPGEGPSSTERSNGLLALNRMIDSWSARGILIPWLTQDLLLSLTGSNSYTIGTGQTFNTAKPLIIKSASCFVSSTYEQACKVVPIDEYQAIRDKARTGALAEVISYVPVSAAAGLIFVWPLATGSKLNLWSYKALSTLASLSTTLSLPEGYEHALVNCLALILAPTYSRAPGDLQLLKANADEAIATIQSLNAAVLGPLPSLTPPPAAKG